MGESRLTLMKTDKKEQFRHEAKYLIGLKEKALLTQRFESILNLDRHAQNGGYTIRSLYFDDYWNSSYEEKAAGILMRKKYRIRIYNFSDRSIKLERKKKFENYIYKEAAPLTREEVEKIIEGDYGFLLHSPHPLCREFYFECVTNVMRPRVIVDYEREPWVYDAGTVRLTFDSNVRAAVGSYDISKILFPQGLQSLSRYQNTFFAMKRQDICMILSTGLTQIIRRDRRKE